MMWERPSGGSGCATESDLILMGVMSCGFAAAGLDVLMGVAFGIETVLRPTARNGRWMTVAAAVVVFVIGEGAC